MPAIVIPAPNANVKKSDIVDNLTSTSTTAPLSANMGKALNDNFTRELGSKTLADFETALVTLGNSLSGAGVAHFTVTISAASGVFGAAAYIGFIERIAANRFAVTLSRNVTMQSIAGRYSGSWAWKELTVGGMLTPDSNGKYTIVRSGSYNPVLVYGILNNQAFCVLVTSQNGFDDIVGNKSSLFAGDGATITITPGSSGGSSVYAIGAFAS